MSQTILIENNEDLNKLYSINLNTYAGTDVIQKDNAQDAIDLLELLPNVNLIIVGSTTEEADTALTVYQYLEEKGLSIPMIVLKEHKELSQTVLCLKEPIDWELIIKHACNFLGVTPEELQRKILPDYIPVNVNYFYEIEQTPCDVYIRIKKSPSEYQYVKRLHAQDTFSNDDIDKYKNQNLTNFYVLKDYQQYFVNFLTTNLIKKLEKTDLSLFERITTNSNAYTIVADKIHQIGFDESLAELASHSIDSMIKAVKESPKLASLLKMLLSSKISYAYQHAHLVVVFGEFILSKQPWYEAKHLDILTSAAFFSDITLKSIDQIRINSLDDLNHSKLTREEKEEVMNHALDASLLIKEHPAYSEYLEKVVREHQGVLNGVGFASDPDESIHPIAKVFIVSDAFVKIMLDPNGPKQKKDILTILYAQFTNPSYQKIIKVLEQKMA